MKKFFSTKISEMTIGQSVVYVLVIMIVSIAATFAALMMPQAAEELFDWVEEKADSLKEKFTKKKPKEICVEYEKI